MRKKITLILIIMLCVLMAVPWGVFAQAVNAEKGTEQTQQQTTTPAPTPTPETTAPAAEPTLEEPVVTPSSEPTPEQPTEAPAEPLDESVSTLSDYPEGRAVLDTGVNVNRKLHSFGGYMSSLKRSYDPAPSGVKTENLSISNVSVTVWWDKKSGTIYWYSQDPKPLLNANSNGLFLHCGQLTSLDLSHFDTSHVTDMSYMFSGCSSLISIDVSSFETSSVNNMYAMFWGCNKLKTIYASDKFLTKNAELISDVFYECEALVGGNGTKYDKNNTGTQYARIDKPYQPGYFTEKKASESVTDKAVITAPTSLSVEKGKTAAIGATVSSAEDGGVMTYQSADTKIATVDNKGNVTGVAEGKTTITINSAATEKYQEADPKTVTVTVTKKVPAEQAIAYRTHVQNVGWQPYVTNGTMAGTSGQSLRLEGMNINLQNQKYTGDIEYRTHIQNIGWESEWKKNDVMSGTNGQALRLEAMQVRLTGEMAKHYDVYYRVHAQNFGWLNWAKNGEQSGTAGYAYRLEGMQIMLVNKGGAAPNIAPNSQQDKPFVEKYKDNVKADSLIAYQTHVQNVGWQNYAVDGGTAGTSGLSYRLEGMKINLNNPKYAGDIEYRTHIQNIGWENEWKKNDALSGTSGQALRLEAMQVKLTGEMANHYDVYYRVHAQNFGWLGWAKNGEKTGSEKFGYRLEAMQIVLVNKGQSLPSYSPASNREEAFITDRQVYDAIINKYNHAIAAKYSPLQCNNEGLYWQASSMQSLGYALMDLDRDGIQELLIGETGEPNIYDIYHIKNGQVQKIFKNDAEPLIPGPRSRYYYLGSNKILHTGSYGAESIITFLYQYKKGFDLIDGSESKLRFPSYYTRIVDYYVYDNGVRRQTNESEMRIRREKLSQIKKTNYEITLFPALSK